MTRVLRGTLLLALAGLIARLLASGQMALYMSPALDPLTGLTGLALAGMGAFELVFGLRSLRFSEGDPHGSITDQVLTAFLVLLPVGLGLFTSPHALDSSAINGRDVTRVVVGFSSVPPASPVRPPPRPIQDVADLFGYLREAGEGGVGQPVHVLGIVARSDGLEANQFVLLRYRIVHCVADAQPVGLLVVLPDSGTAWPTDAWVEIDGKLASRDQAGAHLVSVLAEHVAEIDEPPNPYLQTL